MLRNAITTTATEWGVSYSEVNAFWSTGSCRDDAIKAREEGRGVTLNVHRCDETARNAWGGLGVSIKHPEHDGRTFATVEAATEYALAVGLLKVYEPSRPADTSLDGIFG